MVEEILNFLGNLGERDDEDDNKRRKKRGKHEDEDDEDEAPFIPDNKNRATSKPAQGSKVLIISIVLGLIVLVLIGVIAYLLLR